MRALLFSRRPSPSRLVCRRAMEGQHGPAAQQQLRPQLRDPEVARRRHWGASGGNLRETRHPARRGTNVSVCGGVPRAGPGEGSSVLFRPRQEYACVYHSGSHHSLHICTHHAPPCALSIFIFLAAIDHHGCRHAPYSSSPSSLVPSSRSWIDRRYDYFFEHYGSDAPPAASFQCMCGAKNCRWVGPPLWWIGKGRGPCRWWWRSIIHAGYNHAA